MGEEITINSDDSFPLNALPKSAVQALYHAVTGKTEKLNKPHFGNVIITEDDIDHLLSLIGEQICHYSLLAQPTLTVVIKDGSHRSSTYSSWERYKTLRIATKELTSEVSFKIEFVMQLPETSVQQRCIINVNLDSALPLMCNQEFTSQISTEFTRFVLKKGWLALDVSIDFVDFLVAKNFMTHIEGWFDGLSKTHKPKLSNFLMDRYNIIMLTLLQAGRIGLAAFLISAVYFSGAPQTLESVMYIAGTGLLILSLIEIVQSKVASFISGRLIRNIIPGVILLTKIDSDKYNELISNLTSPILSLMGVSATFLISIGINILSSYIYTWITST